MLEKLGYAFGVGIAATACASFFFAGKYVGENYTNPEPCIRSLYSLDYNYISRLEQEMIDRKIVYDEDSDMYKAGINNSREFLDYLYEYAAENGGFVPEIHVDNLGREYIIPYKCYVGKTDWLNAPIMYKQG